MFRPLYYPFDLIKCRIQTKNSRYQYKNLIHAFSTEIKKNGILGLYAGAPPSMMSSTLGTSVQFTVYESVIKYIKDNNSKKFEEKEALWVVFASILSGIASSLICNAPEALVVLKQTEPESKLINFIRRERFRLFTKGLGVNMYYQSTYAAILFLTVTYISKIFNVQLED